MKTWWPHVRAALVALHLLAITIAAVPAPVGGMNRRAWSDPTVQDEMRTWSAILHVDQKALEDFLWSFANDWMRGRRAVMQGIWPYLEITGTDQPWRMFVAPHRYPSRYQVQARAADGEWQTLFEERSREHRWRARFFGQERIRSIVFRYSWPEYGYDAKRFCELVAKDVFAERDDVTEVRCRFYKAKSPSAAEVRAGAEPQGTWTQEKKAVRR